MNAGGKRTIATAGVLILALAGTFLVVDQQYRSSRQQRESHFISIHYLATQAMAAEDTGSRMDLEDLIEPYGAAPLLEAFPDGLLYECHPYGFRLEEPEGRRISCFHTDRLVSTETDWPRWESSGELAKKSANHVVPPSGYR